MKIAIIEDEKAAREELKYLIGIYLKDCSIKEYGLGKAFIADENKKDFDLAFIDIHLGDIDGMTIARLLKDINSECKIIFVTAYQDYALESYDVGAFDYLTKPLIEKRFEKLCNRLTELDINNKIVSDKFIKIFSQRKTYFVDIESIVYIESVNRKTWIYTTDYKYSTNESLQYFEKSLPSNIFFRSHKSYIINISYLAYFECYSTNQYDVSLKIYEDIKIPISRTKITEFKKMID